MKKTILKAQIFLKGFILFARPHIFLGWLRSPMMTMSNMIGLSKWISQQDTEGVLDDFYTAKRDYDKRLVLYQHVLDKMNLAHEPINYYEFGVCSGRSFKWWLGKCPDPDNRFYGFDTFEGLPEGWGIYGKGEMASNMPVIDDDRVKFIKGLFQDTVPEFIANHDLKQKRRKIIHLDADLFSSTLYALTSLAPYLQKGDILIFDEFNVPNHEYFAFKMFCDSFYFKTRLLGAVNNYFQVALMIV